MIAGFFVWPAAIEFCVILVICRGYLLDTGPVSLIYSLNNVWGRPLSSFPLPRMLPHAS